MANPFPPNDAPPLTQMTPFEAAMIVDGEWDLTPFPESQLAYLAAMQILVNTGMAWTLQGRIGRTAADLLKAGLIFPAEPPRTHLEARLLAAKEEGGHD